MNNSIHKRWIAIGLFFLCIIAFILLIIYPLFISWKDSYEKQSELVFKLHKQQSTFAIEEAVSANLDEIKKQFQTQNYFTTQETESLASAELQNILKMAIAQNGGQLISTQGLPSENLKFFLKIIVSVRLVANIESLASILAYLESNNPVMLIDQLDISPIRNIRSSNNLVNQNSQLNVNFKIFSFMRLKF